MRAPTNPFQCISLTSMWWYLYHFYATMAIKSFKGVTKICQRPCNDGRQIYHHTCRKWPSVKILISVDKKESDMLNWYHKKVLFFHTTLRHMKNVVCLVTNLIALAYFYHEKWFFDTTGPALSKKYLKPKYLKPLSWCSYLKLN